MAARALGSRAMFFVLPRGVRYACLDSMLWGADMPAWTERVGQWAEHDVLRIGGRYACLNGMSRNTPSVIRTTPTVNLPRSRNTHYALRPRLAPAI